MKHVNITVIGKVQGVFYRASTRTKADDLGIKGFVKNEPDGSVYIEAEGDENNLNELIEWCSHGPPSANVKDVEVKEGNIINFSTFEIKR